MQPRPVLAVLLVAACGGPQRVTGHASDADRAPPSPAVSELRATPEQRPSSTALATASDEALGPLALGMSDVEVERAIGRAERTTPPVDVEQATGDWVATWDYPSRGLRLGMAGATERAPTRLRSITAVAPSRLRTTRGIGIGSAAAEIEPAYGAAVNVEESAADRIVVGSVYGGILFGVEQGKVTSIFVGAAAE